jgi:ATP-binding cassette subfamily F protein 3
VTRTNGVRVGWLPQDLAVVGGRSLIDMILASVPGRTDLDAGLAAAESELEDAVRAGAPDDQMMDLAADIAELHERIDHFDRVWCALCADTTPAS